MMMICNLNANSHGYCCVAWRRDREKLLRLRGGLQAAGLSCTSHTHKSDKCQQSCLATTPPRSSSVGLDVRAFYLFFWLGLFIYFLQTMKGCSLAFYLPPA